MELPVPLFASNPKFHARAVTMDSILSADTPMHRAIRSDKVIETAERLEQRILARFPGVVLAAVYAVPDAEVGDQVMAALQFSDLSEFDPAAFDAFLQEQEDLGTKWSPRYVRLSEHLPVTQTAKVMKRTLRTERWECGEPVFFRPAKGAALQRLISADVARLRQEFEARGRDNLLI